MDRLAIGVVYGISVALLVGGIVALCTFMSGLEFKEALVLGVQIGVMMVPTASGACMLALIMKKTPEPEPEIEEEPLDLEVSNLDLGLGDLVAEFPCDGEEPSAIDIVFQRVVECAWAQVELVYRDDVTPTRKYVTNQIPGGYTQIEWNSSRALLVAMGIVIGQQWAEITLSALRELLGRVRFDWHSESAGVIFVPTVNSRAYQRLPVALPPVNGSYLTAPPQGGENARFSG